MLTNVQRFGHFGQGFACVFANRVAANENHRVLTAEDHARRNFDVFQRRGFRVRACTVERDFALRHILQGYVHGQIDVRCAGFALALGVFECQPCDFRDGIGPHDKLGALGHRLEHLGQIEKLVRRQVNFVGGNLPGDGDQRRAVGIGVCHAGDEVGCAGTERRQANACAACQPTVNVRHKGRALLMANRDKPNI